MKTGIDRLLLAAPHSGGGKTTITCGLLQLFKNRGLKPAAFKCGPDYIDPLFHRRVVGAQSGNLDLFFTNEQTTRSLFAQGSEGCGIAVLEGVMGFYDGIGVSSSEGSSYHMARVTETPVIFVVDVRGASFSVAALIKGFAEFQPQANIQGVILNKCSQSLHDQLTPVIEQSTGITVLGYVPNDESFAIKSRHLGLYMADEVADLKEKLQLLAQTLEQTLDIEALLRIAKGAPEIEYEPFHVEKVSDSQPVIAVAQDEAFAFYYEENKRMLEEMGAKLVEFSPLHDQHLPEGTCGIYLGGGYPELHGRELSTNTAMKEELRRVINAGIPVMAECGGFLYLQETIEDDEANEWEMLQVLPGKSRNEHALKKFGYITVTAEQDNLLCKAGESIRGHEFHYWHSTNAGFDFIANKPKRDTKWSCIVATKRLVAGFPHVYFPANPHFPANFISAMEQYKEENE